MMAAAPRQGDSSLPHRHAALIEIDGSHVETLYSHAQILMHLGFSVHLLLRSDMRDICGDAGPVANVEFFDVEAPFLRSLPGIRRILAYLGAHDIDTVVLNTAEGRRARNFCVLARSVRRYVGTIHNAHKLDASLTQRFISRRLDGYLVLSEFIHKSVAQTDGRRVETIYPIYFPEPPATPRDPNHFKIVVPGRIDPRRRDYLLLADQLGRHGLHPDVRIALLGEARGAAADEVMRSFAEAGVADQVEVSQGFVEQGELLSRVAGAQVVLPLITPRSPGFEHYRTTKISGAYNLAYGFAVPMLNHASLRNIDELRIASVFYDDDNLLSTINAIAEEPAQLAPIRQRIASHDAFSIESQARRYAKLLGIAG